MNRPRLVFHVLVIFTALLVSVTPLHACSICFGGNNAYWARIGYYSTTIAMILLPVSLAGGFTYWIRTQISTKEQSPSKK